MSDILFKCSSCRQGLAVEGDTVGSTVECANCGKQTIVPIADIVWRCAACDAALSAPSIIAGDPFDCPSCGSQTVVPRNAKGGNARLHLSAKCPSCAAAMAFDDSVCTSCGYDKRTGKRHGIAPSPYQHSSMGQKRPTAKTHREPFLTSGMLLLILVVGGIFGYQKWWKPAKERDGAFGRAFQLGGNGCPTQEAIAGLEDVARRYPSDVRTSKAKLLLDQLLAERQHQSEKLEAEIGLARQGFEHAPDATIRSNLASRMREFVYATNQNQAAILIAEMDKQLQQSQRDGERKRRQEEYARDERLRMLNEQLCLAAGDNQFDAVDRLIGEGANINPKQGKAPILRAYEFSRLDMISHLIDKGADPTPVVRAAASDKADIKTLQYLFEKGVKFNDCIMGAFWQAKGDRWMCNPVLAKFLLEHGAAAGRANNRGENALHLLAQLYRGYARCNNYTVGGERVVLSVAELFLDKGCDPNARAAYCVCPLPESVTDEGLGEVTLHNASPLDCAVEVGDVALIRLLVSRGAKINPTETNAVPTLMLACRDLPVCRDYGPCEQVRLDNDRLRGSNRARLSPVTVAEILVDMGANVRCSFWGGRTALHEVAERNSSRVAAKLIKAGADVNAQSDDRTTPLHIAAANSDAGMTALLLTAGASASSTNAKGDTPLHLASATGAGRCVELLIKAGTQVDAQNAAGDTALIIAARRTENAVSPIFAGLIRAGARIDLKHGGGQSASDILIMSDREDNRKVGYMLLKGDRQQYLDMVDAKVASDELARQQEERQLAGQRKLDHARAIRQRELDIAAENQRIEAMVNREIERNPATRR